MKGLFVSALASALLAGVESRGMGYGFPQYDQKFLDGYSRIKHTGDFGPYSNRQAVGIDRDPPEGCTVDQVILLHRHGTRYPQPQTGAELEETLKKFQGGPKLNGSLAFANDWQYFVPSDGYYQLEFATGPYSGLADAYQRGAEYAVRYGHLWDGESMVPIFAGGFERVLQTGRKFGEGFMGYNYSTLAAVQVISETPDAGADTTAPACNAKQVTSCKVPDQSVLSASPFLMPEFQVAANRFNAENPALNATATDVFLLLKLASYEIVARGRSPWADAFTDDEFVAFEYASTVPYYCYYGPGSPTYGQQIGSVFANASLTLLKQGPQVAGTMFWTFTHDIYVTAALSALGVLIPSEPTMDRVNFDFMQTYKVSDIVPMAGHLTIERLSCSGQASDPYISANKTSTGEPITNATAAFGSSTASSNQTYVRLVLNEAVLPVDGCADGPGYSCSLASYENFITTNLKTLDFVKDCDIAKGLPQYLSFYWNWNRTTEHNYPNGTMPFQATYFTN